jgi:hypothetical protein
MISREDIQSWLERLEGGSLAVRELEPNIWLVRSQEGAEVCRAATLDAASSSGSCSNSMRGSWCTARTDSRATTLS